MISAPAHCAKLFYATFLPRLEQLLVSDGLALRLLVGQFLPRSIVIRQPLARIALLVQLRRAVLHASALQTLQNTKVVSNPTIVTLNNKQAVINVGEERPIPSYTYNSERGVYEVSGFQYRPIGIILKVTPQVNARGTITLTVEPEVSQSTRDANFNGASIPIVESRKASTMVALKDGYTMGIGIQPIEIEQDGQIVPLKAEVVEGGSVSLRTSFYALLPASPQRPAMIYVKSTPPRLLKGLLLQLRVIP